MTVRKIHTIAENCTSCRICVSECRFLQEHGTPGELSRTFLKVTQGDFNEIFQCNLCGLCQSVCPKNLDCTRAFLEIRRALQTCSDKPSHTSVLAEHTTICRYEAIGTSALFSLYLLPENCTAIFFPGCALAATRAPTVRATYEYLKTLLPNVGIVLDCCSKPSRDLGLQEKFRKSFDRLTAHLEKRNIRKVITACPSCLVTFSKYAQGFDTVSVYELLAQFPPPTDALFPVEMAVHDTCMTRNDSALQDSVRQLAGLGGARLTEMEHSRSRALCCGEGAAAAFVAPQVKKCWTDRRRDEVNGKKVITYCAGCAGSLAGTVDTTHILDLLFANETALSFQKISAKPPLTYLHRLKLKYTLRKNAAPEEIGERPQASGKSRQFITFGRVFLLLLSLSGTVLWHFLY